MITCEFCGNPVAKHLSLCPYCQQPLPVKKETAKLLSKKIKTINLEYGKPFVKEALERFNTELKMAQNQNIGLLKIIHGYGSSGKGGKIKIALHHHLKKLIENHQITKVIYGENYSISTKSALNNLKLTEVYPELAETIQADKYNPGICFVAL